MGKETLLEHTFVHMLTASRTLSVHVSVLQWEGNCNQNLFQRVAWQSYGRNT